jgi:hypothetical protein
MDIANPFKIARGEDPKVLEKDRDFGEREADIIQWNGEIASLDSVSNFV